MHFSLLTAVELPEDYQKEYTDVLSMEIFLNLKVVEDKLWDDPNDAVWRWKWHTLRNINSPFGWAVQSAMSSKMEAYYTDTEDERYIEFLDEEDSLRQDYEDERCDCFRLPEGKIVTRYDGRGYPFVIRDGKVYQRQAGRLHHEMRTKKAKRMQALPDYPMKKLYPTFDDYATKHCYVTKDKKFGRYGCWQNPNAIFDAIELGGRWPFAFLVKDTCKEYSPGVWSWTITDEPTAPDGYKWVAAARKKDIEWDAMFQAANERIKRFYDDLMRYLDDEKFPKENGYFVEDGKVKQFGEELVRKDESFREFRRQYGLSTRRKYSITAFSLLDGDRYADRDEYRESGKHEEAQADQ